MVTYFCCKCTGQGRWPKLQLNLSVGVNLVACICWWQPEPPSGMKTKKLNQQARENKIICANMLCSSHNRCRPSMLVITCQIISFSPLGRSQICWCPVPGRTYGKTPHALLHFGFACSDKFVDHYCQYRQYPYDFGSCDKTTGVKHVPSALRNSKQAFS